MLTRERDAKGQAAPVPTGRHLISAVAWTAAAKWCSQIVSWASLIVVLRILTPEDFGIYGLATTYLGLLTVLGEFGISAAVLMIRDLTEEQLQMLNTLSVLLGVVVIGLSLLCTNVLSAFFRMPEIGAVAAVLSVTFLIACFRSVPYALLQRDLRFSSIAVSEAVQSIVQALITVALVYTGARFWGLVAGAITGSIVATVQMMYWRPCRFQIPRFRVIRHAVLFSGHVSLQRIGWYLYLNADRVVAGRLLGARPLGQYTFAWNLACLPGDKVLQLLGRVTPAFFAGLQHDPAAMKRYFLFVSEAMALLLVPATAGLIAIAGELVPFAFGSKWAEAILPLQLLAVAVLFRSMVSLIPQVLNVMGEERFGVWMTLANVVVLPPAFYVGSSWGVTGIAAAWLTAYPVLTVPWFRKIGAKLSMSLWVYIRATAPPIVASLIMVAGVFAVQNLLGSGIVAAVRLAIEVATGAGLYAAALVTLYPDRVRDYRNLYRRIRAGKEAPD
jgi:PST family polysaccharide transporter